MLLTHMMFTCLPTYAPQASVNTFTSLIDACGKSNQLPQACELLEQMQAENVPPNAHTFTTIINACTQLQDLDRGLQVRAAPPCWPTLPASPTIDCYSSASLVRAGQCVLWRVAPLPHGDPLTTW